MNLNRKTSTFAGVLIILGIVVGILSIVPSVESANYLIEVFPNKSQVLLGALFQLFLVPIYTGFALLLYPRLKEYKENLAIGFVVFRMIAGVFQVVGVILLPMFILLSHEFIKSEAPNVLYFEMLGELLKIGRDLTNHLGVMLAMGLGNLLLYSIFYKTRLVPLWLSIWGGLGNLSAILSSFLILLGIIDVISISFAIMTVPLVVQEIVLSFWLIFKGFEDKNTAHASGEF